MSLRDWFLTPAERRAPPADAAATRPQPPRDSAAAWAAPDHAGATGPPHESAPRWAPPVAAPPTTTAPVAAPSAPSAAASIASPGFTAPVAAPPAPSAAASVASPAFIAPVADSPAPSAAASIASAAVIGRRGEAEAVAAGMALALRGDAPAAAVIVVAEQAAPTADGGTPAARRLAARLDAHGFAAAARGRLVWAYVEPDAALRAALVAGEPAVLAITVPLDPALELAIADQDLAIVVTRDEHGPLAQIATASLAGHNVTVTGPLPRGLPRLMARWGLRAPAELRLVSRA
jgi:hypothetical protein